MTEIDRTIPQIVKKYRNNQSLRDFAQALTLDLPGENVTYQTVKFWADGTFRPNRWFLIRLLMNTRDWRFDFAADCLTECYPEVYGSIRTNLPVADQLTLINRERTK